MENKILFCTAICDGEINGDSVKKNISGLYPSVCQHIANLYSRANVLDVKFTFVEHEVVDIRDLNKTDD